MISLRPLTAAICILIVTLAWGSAALARSSPETSLSVAAVITALCATILLLRQPGRRGTQGKPLQENRRHELALFRGDMFNLCAALRLGISFCERHMDSEPDLLIERLEIMADNIHAFVNEVTRPVRLRARGDRTGDPVAPRSRQTGGR